MADVLNGSEAAFEQEVLQAAGPVFVDFWAPWCGYCARLSPVIDALAAELGDKVKVVKINVDENRGLSTKYGIMSLPTMILFKQGQQVEKLMGYMPKENITAKISPHL